MQAKERHKRHETMGWKRAKANAHFSDEKADDVRNEVVGAAPPTPSEEQGDLPASSSKGSKSNVQEL